MRYHFRNADGKTCCENNNIEHLCDRCKAQARATTASRAASLRVAAVHDDDDAVPEPPDMNARIRAAAEKRHASPAPRAKAPTPEQRNAAVRENMKAPAPPADLPLAIRTAARRAYAFEHDVPQPISNEEQNRRIVERGR